MDINEAIETSIMEDRIVQVVFLGDIGDIEAEINAIRNEEFECVEFNEEDGMIECWSTEGPEWRIEVVREED